MPEVDPLGPVYVINRCPDVHDIDDVTRRRCQAEVGGSHLDRLPVVGRNTGALYRNAFCAACHGERDRQYVYWVAKLALCNIDSTALTTGRYVSTRW